MTIRFGVSPIAWINDDMPELGGDTPLSKLLNDAADVGFHGVELGGAFPRDPRELAAVLGSRGLDLIGGWFSTDLLVLSAEEQIAALQEHLALLKAMGCTVFVAAECSNTIHNRREVPLSQRPHLTEAEWARFAATMTAVADYVAAQGMRFAYHHHIGTVVETQADLDTLLALTGPNVGLTVDTGHAWYGGIDVARLLRGHPARIAHVHCKDVRANVMTQVRVRNTSFLDGVLAGMFTVPGDGAIDYGAVVEAMAEIGYTGWIVIEAEQDPALADPRAFAQIGFDHLTAAARAARLAVAA